MSISTMKDKLKQTAQTTANRAKAAAQKPAQTAKTNTRAGTKSTDTRRNGKPAAQTAAKKVSQKAAKAVKTGSATPAKRVGKQAAKTVAGKPQAKRAAQTERAMQRTFDQTRFARDLVTRQNVRAENFAKTGTLVGKKIKNPVYNQMVADETLKLKLTGEHPDKPTYKEIIDSTALDPLSALKADSRSYANFGRNVGMKSKEKSDKEKVLDFFADKRAEGRKKRAKKQTLSRYDNRLSQQFRDEIRLAKEDYDAAKRRGDTEGMEKAHQRAETWRRIQGGYSGGDKGNEYNTPDVTNEDRSNLTKEGLTRLRAAKLGYENAQTDEERARYAAQGAAIRRDPTLRKEGFDRGAYRETDSEGRMRYAGTAEERKREQDQAAAIPKAIGTGIAGSFLSIPGTTGRALQADAARNRDFLQALSDIRGGGEVNVSEPEAVDPDSLAQRLLRQSQGYREQATEGQRGLERYLTEALITGGEMAPGLLAAAATGGATLPSLAVMGAQAAGREMGALEGQGADPVEAFERGVVSGAIEAGTELIPLRNLTRIARGGGDSFARNLLTQALEEVGTEEASELLGYGADLAFRDPNASLTAQDLLDTAAISALTSIGMGAGAGMIGARRSGRTGGQTEQADRTTAAMDRVTPTVDALAEQEAAIQGQIETWKMQANRLLERLQTSAQDPTWHKHLLGELAQHQAQGEQLRQQLVGLEMQKAQRTQVEQEKAQQAQRQAEEAQRTEQERPEAQAVRDSDVSTLPPASPVPLPLARGGRENAAQEAPQETAGRPQTVPGAEQAAETTRTETPAEGQETARATSRQYGQPENHIDNRDAGALGDRKVKAFQWDHPEIKPFYQEAAQALKTEVEASLASRQTVRGSNKDRALGRKTGTLMARNEPLRKLHDLGLSSTDILKACDALISDHGQENVKAAKLVELALDDMLSNGYTPVEAGGNPDARIGANQDYIRTKEGIAGGVAQGSFEQVLRDNALPLELGEVTEEELRAEWEAGQNQEPEDYSSMEEELADLQDRMEILMEEAETDGFNQEFFDEQLARMLEEERAIREKWSVGAAPGGFDPLSDWQLGTDQFHPINDRAVEAEAENWGRAPVDIPVRDPFGQLTSKTASTLINAGMTPDQISRGLAEMARNGQLSRIPYTDSAATAEAERIINEQGYQRAKERWLSDIHAGKMSKDLTTMGIVLYNNAANSGHIVEAMDLAIEMIEYGKTAGQVLQAVNIINKLGPTGKLYSLASSLEKLENKIRQNKKLDAEHWDGITIPEDLGKAYMEAQTEEEQLAIETEIKKAVAQQIPNTLGDKLDAWRYMAMLGNPRTQIRNIVGNLGFQPVRIAKNMIGAGLERMMGLDPSERTKSLQFKGLSRADKARYDAGLAEYDSVESIIMGNGKYNDTFSDIDQYRTIFRFKPFEGWRQLTNAGLEKGDVFFAKRTYADSLAGVLKARGITAEEYTDPAFSPQTREAIQAIAIEEAQKATYRDLNQFSQFIMKKLGGTPQTTFEKGVHYLTEGLLPFKKTPANILVRGIEYSPIGLIKGIADMNTKVRSGEMTAAQGIDELASGLTGTALMGLGAVLGLAGIVTPGDDEDDAQNKFNQLLGKQSYALNLPGGYSITLDWMAPEAIPFFMGVELQKGIQDIRAGEKGKDVVWNFLRRISDPMLEMSMLQGVNDLLDNLSYADNKFMSVISTLATGYLTQFVPTIGGQIERSFEDRRYSTWIDRDSAVPSEIQYLLGKTFNKLPGEYHQREYLNAWGEPEMTGNPALRIFSNFISPGYIKKEQGGEVEAELQRLYDNDFNVFPTIEKTSTKINGEPMSMEQFNLLQSVKGQTMKDLYTQAINSDEYKELADADKADYLSKLEKYATVKGKQAAGENPDKVPEWIVKLDSAAAEHSVEVSALLRASLTMDTKYDADGNGTVKTEEAWDGIQDMTKTNGLSENEQKALFDIYNGTSKTYDEYKAEADEKARVQANIDKYISALPNEMQTSLMDACGGNLNSFTQAEAYDAILNLGGTYEQQKAAFDGIQAARGDNAWKENGVNRTFDSFMKKQGKEETKKKETNAIWGDAPQEDIDAFRSAVAANEQSYHGFFKACEQSGIPRNEWPSAFKDTNNKRGSKAFNKSFEQAYYHVYGKEWAI